MSDKIILGDDGSKYILVDGEYVKIKGEGDKEVKSEEKNDHIKEKGMSGWNIFKIICLIFLFSAFLSYASDADSYFLMYSLCLFCALLVFFVPQEGYEGGVRAIKNYKNHKSRILLLVIAFIFCAGVASPRVAGNIEQNEISKTPTPSINFIGNYSGLEYMGSVDVLMKIENADSVSVAGNKIYPTEGSGYNYSYTAALTTPKTTLSISLANGKKTGSGLITITRDMSDEELQAIVEKEKKIEEQRKKDQEEAAAAKAKKDKEQKEWDASKAGKLCKTYPQWSKDDCIYVSERRYWIGMTYEMLIESRGKPNSANPSNYGYGTQWQWCWYDYTPSCFYDSDGDRKIDSFN